MSGNVCVTHRDRGAAGDVFGPFIRHVKTDEESPGLQSLNVDWRGLELAMSVNARLPGQLPEAGEAIRIGQFHCVDDLLGGGGFSAADAHGDPRDSACHDLDLARIEPRMNQPAPGALKGFQVSELMSQVSHLRPASSLVAKN
jgi:hypothetical protein